ncbi:MAG: TRAP transporter substrate-binding protein DctP, partial [Chloroflexota bacterium]
DKLLANGIRILNPNKGWESKSFELLFSTMPVFTPDDLIGKRFRSYESKLANTLRETLQSIPVQVRWKESYQAFKDGLIDLFLSPTAYTTALNLHEVTNYTTIIDYGYTQNLVMAMSEYEYRKLSPSLQNALAEAIDETGSYYAEIVTQESQLNIERFSSEFGMPVIHPDATIWRRRFNQALYSMCIDQGFLDKEMYEALQAL